MNLTNQHIAILLAGLLVVTAVFIYLGINTGSFSGADESLAREPATSGNRGTSTTDADSAGGPVSPKDLEAEHAGIINLGG